MEERGGQLMRTVVLTLVTGCLLLRVPGLVGQAPPAPPGYALVWADEFDRDGAPDAARWVYEEGFVRNNEAQWYTRDRRENARIERGMLVIEGRKETVPNPRYDPARANEGRNRSHALYSSASLNTRGKAAWRYGRIEVRARLPHGKGVWPAVWMLGDNIGQVGWPACGEIDIMEFVGHTPDRTHATLHWRNAAGHTSNGHALNVDRPWEAFHVYSVDWTSERMEFRYDNEIVHAFDVATADQSDGSNPFRQPQYLLINLALGGSWGRDIDDQIFPQQFEIDYVRVYRRVQN